MNNIKSTFSIKDLENLTGVKAHTIRIWEKRYNLLQPERTDTNIRYYDLESLQALLNISFLNENGYKISKIASLTRKNIAELVRDMAVNNNSNDHALNMFKLAMLNFDQVLFYKTYDKLSKEKTLQEIFYGLFIPLLSEIGVLWQTDTITPAHEHFVTTIIRQKIMLETEKVQSVNQGVSDSTFVLFLPDNEIHELGLMYLNLEILSKGHKSILLGQSVPMKGLVDILDHYSNITFVSYFTIQPEKETISQYLIDFENLLLKNKTTKFWILGKMIEHIDPNTLPSSIKTFQSIHNLIEQI